VKDPGLPEADNPAPRLLDWWTLYLKDSVEYFVIE
jgi:hypothetical protein